MSRMLQALKNLSSRTEANPPPADPAAPAPAAAPSTPAAADPVLPPAEPTRRMQDLLVKHLSAPAPTELFSPAAFSPEQSTTGGGMAWSESPVASGMTMPMGSFGLVTPQIEADSQEIAESVELTFTSCDQPAAALGEASIDAVSDLLSSIDQEVSGPEEEFSLSFGTSEVTGPGDQAAEVTEPELEVTGQASEVSLEFLSPVNLHAAAPSPLAGPSVPPHPLTPSPSLVSVSPPTSLNLEPLAQSLPAEPLSVAASPLDHLADSRPLATYQPQEEEATAAPLVPPSRTICRSKTRLEQRVVDNLSHPSRSLPYRELAERLQQDLRLLSGRCLLFTGIGPASHAEDVLPHVASLLAEEDAEVLLVDADFARAGLTVGLGALKETGLGELNDVGDRCEELVLPTLLPNVSVLPAGRRALPDAMGVVDPLAQLLARLEERYALVLIDGGAHTGPLVPALARLCDATYFVVRLGATDTRVATTALKTFRATGARVMGCVATCAPAAA